MKECAAKGMEGPCVGPATIRCGLCGAVTYCSAFHQKLHWNEHKDECKRMEDQMKCISILHDFPFRFTGESIEKVELGQITCCSFLMKQGLHQDNLWKFECACGLSLVTSKAAIGECLEAEFLKTEGSWNLPGDMCPCREPQSSLSVVLRSWADYYSWRCLPLDSPVALLLHWPLTIYYALQLIASRLQNIIPSPGHELRIHYLGPEKELHQLPVFGELSALFPGVQIHIDFVGPAVPHFSDHECAELNGYPKCLDASCQCKVSRCEEGDADQPKHRQCKNKPSTVALRFWKGFYHERFHDITKVSFPHFIIAPNAGIAAYSSWRSTIELISETRVPAVFSDFCEEAAFLATCCISSVHRSPLALPVQINPFRQPMNKEDTVLHLPTYSNCFLFGIC